MVEGPTETGLLGWGRFRRRAGSRYSDKSILRPRLGRGGSHVVWCLYMAKRLSPRCFHLRHSTSGASGGETSRQSREGSEHSREAADRLDQDQVGLRLTARQHLSAPPQLPRLLQDGVALLLLHFHIVNGHVAAKTTASSARLRCNSELFLKRTTELGGKKRKEESPFHEHLHGVPLQAGLLLKDPLLQHQSFGVTVISLQSFGDEVQTPWKTGGRSLCCLSHSSSRNGDGGPTGVVSEGVENSDEVVQAGPVVWVTVQPLLKGVASQRNAHKSQSQLPDLVPHVDVSGVQHDSLKPRKDSFDRTNKGCSTTA